MASDTNINKASESVPTKENGSSEKQNLRDREVDKLSREAADAASVEVVDATGIDGAAEIGGEVSEVLRERIGENQGGGKGKSQHKGTKAGQIDLKQIKAQLLQNLPEDKVMMAQIQKEIKKEINYLHKKAMRMLRSTGDINYFEMSNILRKIRELKSLLVTLVKASTDAVKTLWLRFVHGIM